MYLKILPFSSVFFSRKCLRELVISAILESPTVGLLGLRKSYFEPPAVGLRGLRNFELSAVGLPELRSN